MHTGLIFSRNVFTLWKQYGGRGSGAVNLDTAPIKHLRWRLFAEIANGYFRKKLHLMFEITLKGFWIHSCITWKHKQYFKQKRKWLSIRNTKKKSATKVVFSQGAGKIWKLQNLLRQKISHFQRYGRPFS